MRYHTWLSQALSLVEAPALLLVDAPSTGEHGCEGWLPAVGTLVPPHSENMRQLLRQDAEPR